MYRGSVASAALLVLYLIFQISAAPAQTSPASSGMATGDVWSSREEPSTSRNEPWSFRVRLRQATSMWPRAMTGRHG